MNKEESPEENNKASSEPIQAAKIIPVFIGTELVDLINLVEAIITDKFPDHIVAILSPKLYAEMAYKYDFQTKSQEQKQEILDLQKNEEKKLQASDIAVRVVNTFTELPKGFTIGELKAAYNRRKQMISHKQIDEIVNFLGLYGYLRQLDVDVPNHKMRYEIILKPEEIRKHLEYKKSVINLKIAQLTEELNGNEEELKSLLPVKKDENTLKIAEKKAIDSKPLKKKSAAKKQNKADDVETLPAK